MQIEQSAISIVNRKNIKTHEEALAERMQDPEYRELSRRHAFASALAALVYKHRLENDLTQKQMAKLLGISQPNLSRLEAASHTPSLETLVRVSSVLDVEIMISIHPEGQKSKLAKQVDESAQIASGHFTERGAEVSMTIA